ncbi:hypothetical protein P4S54_22050 [Shewanella sp. PP-He15 brown]
MPVIHFPYSQSNKNVEKCSIGIFGVPYDASPVCGMELDLYSVQTIINSNVLLNEQDFRLLQIALIYYVYFKRHAFSVKGFIARTKFLQMPRVTKMIVIEAIKRAQKVNTFSLMGSVNPTHL